MWATLSQLGEIVGGGTPSTKDPSYWGDEINWISPSDLTGYSSKTIRNGAKGISRLGLASSSAKVMPAGSVHFSSRAPIGHVVISSRPTATNQGFKSLIPASGILNSYVYYYLIASRDYARRRASGTTFLELSGRAFGELAIPLAPTTSQNRIVAKIEALFSELDEGIKSLTKTRAQLATYRQALLKHAFEGRLTVKWRDEHKEDLETPERLLSRIERQRASRYEQQTREWKASVEEWERSGKASRKPVRPSKLEAFSPLPQSETDDLPSLPDGWSYVRLGLLIDEPRYGTSKKCDYNSEGIGVLRIPNVVDGVISTDDLKGARFNENEMRTFSLTKGDVLMIRSNGSISIVGKCAIVSEAESQYLYAGYLMRLRSNREVIVPAYIVALLGSHLLREQIGQKAKSTSGVNNINAREVQSLIVPVCDAIEQQVVIETLSNALSVIGAADREIERQLVTAKSLRQAILKRAFSGQLMPQDPGDEPAAVLLNRIRTEREQITKRVMARKTGQRERAKATG